MGHEIERKFLVVSDSWRAGAERVRIRQGYLSLQPTVRVRTKGEHGYLTIKGPAEGITRAEYEYEIPRAEADELLDALCRRPLIDKWRYRLQVDGVIWEVDEFLGENVGLIVAEVELASADQDLVLPAWVGLEVSADWRYSNAALSERPFSRW